PEAEKPAKPHDQPFRRETKLPVNPRRVRGGVRMKRKEGDPEGWAEQRMWRIVEQGAGGDILREGLEYARAGQTRRIAFDQGRIEASVQGRRPRAYVTRFTLPRFSRNECDNAVRALAEQSRYAAKLLSGEIPPSIEDVFVPLGLHVFPTGPDEPEISCTCAEDTRWCKHIVCVAALLAERLGDDPFLILELRGLSKEEIVEGLREQRSLSGAGPGPQPVVSAHVAGLSDAQPTPLEDQIEHFWRHAPTASMPFVPVEPPVISHPLLRRLGPSPFEESRFPLVGLLATCYDLIGRDALLTDNPDDEEPGDEPDPESRP
ncbi:MAG: hypothetical protein K8E66_01020, partial [Phycisphaerales bacterium]|nr:hypothetical protein [Phycisphaerales bacterium]